MIGHRWLIQVEGHLGYTIPVKSDRLEFRNGSDGTILKNRTINGCYLGILSRLMMVKTGDNKFAKVNPLTENAFLVRCDCGLHDKLVVMTVRRMRTS